MHSQQRVVASRHSTKCRRQQHLLSSTGLRSSGRATRPCGPSQAELVFIGIDMDEDQIRHRLNDCVLTGREFEKGPQKWAKFKDPLPEWDLSCELDLG